MSRSVGDSVSGGRSGVGVVVVFLRDGGGCVRAGCVCAGYMFPAPDAGTAGITRHTGITGNGVHTAQAH